MVLPCPGIRAHLPAATATESEFTSKPDHNRIGPDERLLGEASCLLARTCRIVLDPVIGCNQTAAKTRGMHIHTTLATASDGLLLGVLCCSFRDPSHGSLKPKAQRWLVAYLDICAAADQISREISVICVMDREGDSIVTFDAQRRQSRVPMQVRARMDRRLANGRKLFEILAGGPSGASARIEIK